METISQQVKKLKTTILILSLLYCAFLQAQKNSGYPEFSNDLGNGSYKNAVIHADYSDPDAIRVGENYYMVSSSFNHVPGLPILQSKDLVNWTLIGHALKKLVPEEHFKAVRHGGGVWAPSIRFHKNEFYIYYPDPDFGIYLTKAKNINGPWTDPILVSEGNGLIDPCPLWDDDGKAYLVHAFAGSRAGIKSVIVVKEMNADGTKIISDGTIVFDGHETDPTVEGPKFYKRNGYYYIFAPAGGVSTGWQLVLRSKNIYGPYERRIVMHQGKTSINGPHQGAWVDSRSGQHWFLHFQDKDAYGRIVHLQPLQWINDWPVIGNDDDADGVGEPVDQYKNPQLKKSSASNVRTDEFNGNSIGLHWQWQANPEKNIAFLYSGFLRMYAQLNGDSANSLWNFPSMLLQKFPAEEFIATIKFKPKFLSGNEQFGVIVFGTDYAALSVSAVKTGRSLNYLSFKNADKKEELLSAETIEIDSAAHYILKVEVRKGAVCSFAYGTDANNMKPLKQTFIAKPGKWVGAKIGLFATRKTTTNDAGFMDVDWFKIEKLSSE